MIRRTRLGAVVEEEDGRTDHGDGIEREGDKPADHAFLAEPIEWLREQPPEVGARVRSLDPRPTTPGYERAEARLYEHLRSGGSVAVAVDRRGKSRYAPGRTNPPGRRIAR